MKAALILLLVTSLFGVLRFVVPVSGGINGADVYKDFAHLFVGGLFGAGIMGLVAEGRFFRKAGMLDDAHFRSTVLCLALAVGLTVLEVVAFFVRKSP